ncbi:MAG: tRNA glutamyl-Q(34) synthetase GluQRS [Rhodobacteraceae bacterium]|nr:tRNA glutamyl-Q(34) synthetase GluQRS [Paracoccaceae bacterium]
MAWRELTWIERFAPSPTGPLHLGHALSALTGFERAKQAGGVFLVRIEDIDQSRCRPKWEAQIFDDLAWLGITWQKPVLRQSTRLTAYHIALQNLWDQGLLYPCSCTRTEIKTVSSEPTTYGPDGLVYPGTCREKPLPEKMPDTALRLKMPAKLQSTIGDIVIARQNMGTSYHLSVVVDDAFQNVTHVTRGEDLRDATPIHTYLQEILGLPTPVYHHHRLILDDNGKRLAKRDDARAISKYRADGASPADIRQMVGL